MGERIAGYDFIRSLAILLIFIGHILNKQVENGTALILMGTLSPGMTMSLLGFISATLLSKKEIHFGFFLMRRFTRIYISLALCLVLILVFHSLLGKQVIYQHTLLHMMGLSFFFDLFSVKNKATIGSGLWFITVIIVMYLLLPMLQVLFRHRRGLIHLLAIISLATALNSAMYGTASAWNVVISFSLGVYLSVTGKLDALLVKGGFVPIVGTMVVLAVAGLSTAGILPYAIRNLLFAFYPLFLVPLLFSTTKKLPNFILSASAFFAGISYEFYILHFYFINEGFSSFFPIKLSWNGQILISFTLTFILSWIISTVASRLRKATLGYFLTNQ